MKKNVLITLFGEIYHQITNSSILVGTSSVPTLPPANKIISLYSKRKGEGRTKFQLIQLNEPKEVPFAGGSKGTEAVPFTFGSKSSPWDATSLTPVCSANRFELPYTRMEFRCGRLVEFVTFQSTLSNEES